MKLNCVYVNHIKNLTITDYYHHHVTIPIDQLTAQNLLEEELLINKDSTTEESIPDEVNIFNFNSDPIDPSLSHPTCLRKSTQLEEFCYDKYSGGQNLISHYGFKFSVEHCALN